MKLWWNNTGSLFSFSFSWILDLSMAVQKFSQSLQDFQFECIGDAETDDEINIGKYLLQYFINSYMFLILLLQWGNVLFNGANNKEIERSQYVGSMQDCKRKKKKNPKPTNNLCLHDVPQFFVACRIQHAFVNWVSCESSKSCCCF